MGITSCFRNLEKSSYVVDRKVSKNKRNSAKPRHRECQVKTNVDAFIRSPLFIHFGAFSSFFYFTLSTMVVQQLKHVMDNLSFFHDHIGRQ